MGLDGAAWRKRWLVAMTAENLADRTMNERVRVIEQAERHTGIDATALDPYTITVWLAAKGSVATRQTYYCHLNAWFRFLVRMDARQDNPMDKVNSPKRRPGVPRPLHLHEINRVLANPRLRQGNRDRILLGALAGLRVHEIAKIHGRDVDLTAGTIQVVGKGGKVAVLPLHPDLLEMAHRYPRNDYWFPSPINHGKPVTGRFVSESISNAFERVGVHATAHQLRHFYATYLVEQGVNIRVVQTLMRHENLNTTALYAKVSTDLQRAALDRLPSFGLRL